VFDIAEECHVSNLQLALGRKRLVRVEDPFLTAVAKEESSTLMGRWKYDHERAKHPFAPRSINIMSFEE
jgi:hypothetical protein